MLGVRSVAPAVSRQPRSTAYWLGDRFEMVMEGKNWREDLRKSAMKCRIEVMRVD
jgi:hypothetical protein